MATETDKIIIEYQANVAGLSAGLKTVQTDMKTTEVVGVTAANNTTAAFVKTEVATKSLKTQLIELKAQLAVATDPRDAERLAKAAGKIKDQLDDATNSAKIFASESKFEQVGNAVGSLVGKLRNLDFKGAADDAKLLVSAISSITFKEALTGLKDLGASLLNVGGALVTNPLFLIGATVAIVATQVYDLVQAFEALSKESKITTDALNSSNQALLTYADRAKLANIAIKESAGIITKSQADQLRNEVKNNAEITALRKKFYDNLQELAKENELTIQKGQLNISESEAGGVDELGRIKKFNIEANKLSTQFFLEERILASTQKQELAAISAKASAEEIKKAADTEREKIKAAAKAKKEEEDRQKALQKSLAPDSDQQFANDLKRQLDGEFDLKQENRKKDADAEKKALDESEQRTKDYYKALEKAANEAAKKKKQQKELEETLQREIGNAAIDALGVLGELSDRRADRDIENSRNVADSEIADLDRQLQQRIISQEEYDSRRKAAEKKQQEAEKEAKRKAFETNKQVSYLQAIISTAQATVAALGNIPYTPANIALAAATAAAGAVQVALIASQPTPKFAKGVIDLKGPGTSTSDSIHAMLSRGESVITSEATQKHKGLLEAINKGKANFYIEEVYLAPILKNHAKKMQEQKDAGFAQTLVNSLRLNSNFKDGNLLESLKMIRQNDKEIAQYIVKNLKDNNSYNARKR